MSEQHPAGEPAPNALTGLPAPLSDSDSDSDSTADSDSDPTTAPTADSTAVPTSGQRPVLGYVLYLTAALLFGVNGTVSKVLLTAVDDATRVSQLRISFAFLILLVVVAVTNPRSLPLRRAELLPVAAFGVIGVAMTQWLFFVALTRLPVGIALLIEFTAPILVVLWVRYVWHRPVRDTIWLGLALGLAGLAMVAQIGAGVTLNLLGVTAAMGAAVALSMHYLLGESCGRRRDSVSLTLWGFGFGTLLWALVAPWWTFPWDALQGSAAPFGPDTTSVPVWGLAVWMVVLGTIMPFWLVLAAIRHIGAAGASIVGMSEPLLAAMVAWVVLGEILTPVQLLGGLVILTGVVIAERARA